MGKNDAQNQDPQLDLLKAKIAFIRASRNVSPLGMVERHPYASLGVAFLLGMGANAATSTNKGNSFPLLTAIAEIGGVASRILPLLISRASSSGG